VVSHAWAAVPDVARVEQALLAHPEATWLCVVWHETGTGMRNPVAALGELAHRLGRRVFVDAVSAFGVEDINVQRDHIDVLTSVANKGVGAVTGLSFVWARHGVVPPLGPDMPRRSMYLSLQNHLTWSRDVHQTPNTPALTAVVAMDEALCLLQEQGMVARTRHLKACSKIVRDGARAMGFSMVLPESQCVDALTSLRLPVDLPVDAFIDVLETRGFVVYPGKGPMHEQNVFQVAVMGHVDTLDCHALVDAMRASATQLRQPGTAARPTSTWTAADLPVTAHGGTRDQRTANHH
jgi:2-aminoethylphosphonate-pyruvate transaminase